jgi:hypothetical protein
MTYTTITHFYIIQAAISNWERYRVDETHIVRQCRMKFVTKSIGPSRGPLSLIKSALAKCEDERNGAHVLLLLSKGKIWVGRIKRVDVGA